MLHIVLWSGGKDSTATVIKLFENKDTLLKPEDRVVILFSEVMYNKEISGHNPDIIKFIYETKSVFLSWGFEVQILHSDKTFLDIFFHKLQRSKDPKRIGMTYGFPISGLCAVKRDCKIKPIDNWIKSQTEEMTVFEGIAIDEPKRFLAMHKKGYKSLLEEYEMTEKDARELCEKYNLLSPQYSLNNGKQSRDGCWFCPNAKLCEHEEIYKNYPDVWKEYVSLEDVPNLAFPKWNIYSKQTLHDRNELIVSKYSKLTPQ